MKKIFLDTSAYSAFKKNNKKVTELILEADSVHFSPIVLGELFSGFDGGRFQETNRKELKEFLQHPAVSILEMTEETAERYSLILHDLKKRGQPVPTNDLWIAASVMENGSVLVTADQHFQNVSQIQTVFV